ncbi:MAG: hypothetical protein V1726_05640 [Methanobacteriota archaeon]
MKMETRIADWKMNFDEIWKALDAQEEKITRLVAENKQLKERIERLEIVNRIE